MLVVRQAHHERGNRYRRAANSPHTRDATTRGPLFRRDRSPTRSRRTTGIQVAVRQASGLASAGGQTNPLVLSLSKDEPWDARGSTGSPRAWEPISARGKLDLYGRPP